MMDGLLGSVFGYGDWLKRRARSLLDPQTYRNAMNFENYQPLTQDQLVDGLLGAGVLGTVKNAAKFVAPRDEAFAIAQRNAAKPVSEGGLGLAPNNTAAERARAMGFDTAPSKLTYHGTRSDISGPIDPTRSDFGFHTGSVEQAEARLRAFATPSTSFPDGANLIPLMRSKYANMLRVKDVGSFHADSLAPQLAKRGIIDKDLASRIVKDVEGDWKKADGYDETLRHILKKRGYHGIAYSNAQEGPGVSYAFSDPTILRSRFAAFDPAKINENDLLGRARVDFLGLLGLGSLGAAGYMNWNNR